MDKRKFLYYNLYRIESNKRIILNTYIEENEIEHSENSNGLLLNLSQLDDKHIDFFYDLYNLENKYTHHDSIQTKEIIKPRDNETPVNYPDYKLVPLEKLILSYSY